MWSPYYLWTHPGPWGFYAKDQCSNVLTYLLPDCSPEHSAGLQSHQPKHGVHLYIIFIKAFACMCVMMLINLQNVLLKPCQAKLSQTPKQLLSHKEWSSLRHSQQPNAVSDPQSISHSSGILRAQAKW